MTDLAEDDSMLRRVFLDARTHYFWSDRRVDDDLLRRIWDLTRMPPTGANCQPTRIVFIKTQDAKELLRPCLSPNNVEKTMAAPVTAVIGYDLDFPDLLPRLYPHVPGFRSRYIGEAKKTFDTAFRNGSLQAAYFILAARSLGLDCGPMGGFDCDMVDAAFFQGGRIKSNLLVNLGYGDAARLPPRSPRLDFDEACKVI